MVRKMAGKSWLKLDEIPIAPGIIVKNPKVGDILDDEQEFYSVSSTLTSVPFQYMVQLDDQGIDYETLTEWQFFQMMFMSYVNQNIQARLILQQVADSDNPNRDDTIQELNKMIDNNPLRLILKDFVVDGFDLVIDQETEQTTLVNSITGVYIDELIYNDLVKVLRKLNNFEKVKAKPGNESAKKYLMDKERKRLRRNANKEYEPYLEALVIGMVNRPEFKYNYEQTMDMRLYTFNQSFVQVQHTISFDKTMIGVSIGFVDTSKINDKSILQWVNFK